MKKLKSIFAPIAIAIAMFLGLVGCMSPLVSASNDGDVNKVKSLLAGGANPNYAGIRGVNGGVPIVWAARNGRVDVVKLLLEKGADPNEFDGRMFFALREAVMQNHPDVVEVLLADPATKVDETSRISNAPTSLAISACLNYPDLVKLLVAHGANTDITHWPLFCNHERAKKLIESAKSGDAGK